MRIIALITLVSGMAFAASENQTTTNYSNTENTYLTKGTVEVGGSLGLGYGSSSGFSSTLNPRAEYFFSDSLSVGGSAAIYSNSNENIYGLGPSFSYYFSKTAKTAAYAGASIQYNKSTFNDNDYLRYFATLGMKYFLTSSVAFGPELSYSTYSTTYTDTINSYTVQSSNTSLDLRFQFSIYL